MSDMKPRRCGCGAPGAARALVALAALAAAARAQPHPLARIANLTYAGGVDTFVPRMEFERWRPLTGRGDPLRNDPTYDYEPPVLERVRYWPPDRPEPAAAPAPAPARADVLLLGTTARRPAQPRPDTRRRYPDALLVPPPPPPVRIPAPAAHPPNTGSQSYALQQATLVYHSSTVDAERVTFPLETVTSDYAGWGPTAPFDAPPATDASPSHDLDPAVRFDEIEHQYSFYRPMLSESPPPPPPPPPAPSPTTMTPVTITGITDAEVESTFDDGTPKTTEYVTLHFERETSTRRTPAFLPTPAPSPLPAEPTVPAPESHTVPSPPPQTTITFEPEMTARPMAMLRPMMSMPLEVTVEDLPPAAGSLHLIIQGHSKVKTYGTKAQPPSLRNSIRDDGPKTVDNRQVKHLHPLRGERMLPMKRSAAGEGRVNSLRELVSSGEGGASVLEASLGIEYDVSDGGDVPLAAYRRGIVDADLLAPRRRQHR